MNTRTADAGDAVTDAGGCPVVVLISGNGSNLQAMIDAGPDSPYRIVAVISNRPEAYGLERAARAGIPTAVLDHREFSSREEFDRNLIREIDRFDPGLIVLAGFMRILSGAFVEHYQGRLLNIHPSLLPAYRGTRTHQRVLDAGDKSHGCSVHFVTEELDGGPVILQAEVPVHSGDSSETLAARVAEQEHRIYPEVLRWFAQGRLRMEDNRVLLDGNELPPSGVVRQNE